MSAPVSMLEFRARRVAQPDRAHEIARLIHCDGLAIADVIEAFKPTLEERQTVGVLLTLGDAYFKTGEL